MDLVLDFGFDKLSVWGKIHWVSGIKCLVWLVAV